jgi:hypothetical protein
MPSSSTPFDYDDSSELPFPSDIESALAQSAPPSAPQRPSIVDQAASYQESQDPEMQSRRQILGISFMIVLTQIPYGSELLRKE